VSTPTALGRSRKGRHFSLTSQRRLPANTLNSAATNGYWGVGPDFNNFTPEVIKVTIGGAATGTYNNGDFLMGDVILHSPNPGTVLPVSNNWTGPTAGTMDYSSSVCYTQSFVFRSNDVSTLLGSTLLGTVTVNNSFSRASALTRLTGTGLAVLAGDRLAFRFTPTAGQSYGSLAGLGLTVNFTPRVVGAVPEPATWALMIVGFGSTGVAVRRRGRHSITAQAVSWSRTRTLDRDQGLNPHPPHPPSPPSPAG
jgi:hypothetical protein